MPTHATDAVTTVDTHYLYEGRAAAYLIVDGGEAAFIDNGTRFSVPRLLDALGHRGLAPQEVRYLIVTHIHLDHGGGTAELAKQCPNATVLAHPRARKHIIDPALLVRSATSVYGEEEFGRVFGVIEPVAEGRVRASDDEEALDLGSRTLRILHMPGHAPHHLAVLDSTANAMFTGDVFGNAYPQLQGGHRPYVNFVSAPPSFKPDEARDSVQRILATGVDRVYVTHFGAFDEVERGSELVLRSIDAFDAVAAEAAGTDLEGDALVEFCRGRALEGVKRELEDSGLDPGDEEVLFWAAGEIRISAQGIAALAVKRRNE